jgi:hypothetical protein
MPDITIDDNRSLFFKPFLEKADGPKPPLKNGDGKLDEDEQKRASEAGGAMAFMRPGATTAQFNTFGNSNSQDINGTNPDQSRVRLINPADHGNKAALYGMPKSYSQNPENSLFEVIGKDGKRQFAMFSQGYGEGDERSGLKDIGADGKVDVSGSWEGKPDPALLEQLRTAHKAKMKVVESYGGTKQYIQAQKLLADIGDIKASGVVTDPDQKSELDALEQALKQPSKDFNINTQQTEMTQFLEGNRPAENLLKDNRLDELSAIHGEDFVKDLRTGFDLKNLSGLDSAIDQKLEAKTKIEQQLPEAGKAALQEELSKLKENLAKLDPSKLPKTLQEFRKNLLNESGTDFANPDYEKKNLFNAKKLNSFLTNPKSFFAKELQAARISPAKNLREWVGKIEGLDDAQKHNLLTMIKAARGREKQIDLAGTVTLPTNNGETTRLPPSETMYLDGGKMPSLMRHNDKLYYGLSRGLEERDKPIEWNELSSPLNIIGSIWDEQQKKEVVKKP